VQRSNHDVTERQADDDQPVQVRSGETPRSPVAKPPGSAEMPGPKRGGANWRSATSSEACSVVMWPAKAGKGRAEPLGFGRRPWKAPLILEPVLKNSSAYGAWNVKQAVVGTGEALLGPRPAGMRSAPAYNRRTREVAGSREGVGGGRSSDDGRDNITRLERRTPASPMCAERRTE
jgi:hypothetical protein